MNNAENPPKSDLVSLLIYTNDTAVDLSDQFINVFQAQEDLRMLQLL